MQIWVLMGAEFRVTEMMVPMALQEAFTERLDELDQAVPYQLTMNNGEPYVPRSV